MDNYAGPKSSENPWTDEKMVELDRCLRLMVAFADKVNPSMECIQLKTKLQNTHEEITRLQFKIAELRIQFNKDLEILTNEID